jgi:hypothetical protein
MRTIVCFFALSLFSQSNTMSRLWNALKRGRTHSRYLSRATFMTIKQLAQDELGSSITSSAMPMPDIEIGEDGNNFEREQGTHGGPRAVRSQGVTILPGHTHQSNATLSKNRRHNIRLLQIKKVYKIRTFRCTGTMWYQEYLYLDPRPVSTTVGTVWVTVFVRCASVFHWHYFSLVGFGINSITREGVRLINAFTLSLTLFWSRAFL